MYIKDLEDGVFYLVFNSKKEKRAVFNGMRLAVKNGLKKEYRPAQYQFIKQLSQSARAFDWNEEGELSVPVSVSEMPRLLDFLISTLGCMGIMYELYRKETEETLSLSERAFTLLEKRLKQKDREIEALKWKEDTEKRHGYS